MLNRLFKNHKPKESNWIGHGFKLIIICGVLFMVTVVVNDLLKAKRADQSVDDKKYCLGKFDTIPCHQLRIEHLLLESRQKGN